MSLFGRLWIKLWRHWVPKASDNWNLLQTIHANQLTMLGKLNQLLTKDTTIMTALSDLQASQAALAAAVQAAITDIQALAAKLAALPSGTADADVEAVVTQLNALASNLTAAVTPTP
jgi:hypothetical protein